MLTSSVARQRWLRQALDVAGIAHWVVLLQDTERGRMLPPFAGPLLLDTVGFERPVLAALLAELHDRRSPLPTLALVAPDDLAAQQVCLLCSGVYAVAADTIPLADLRLWFRYVGLVGPERLASVQPACLGCTPVPLSIRDGDLLRILTELPRAATIQQAAAACVMSERTLKRKLTTLRVALGIPATGVTRHRPPGLAALLWTALGSQAEAWPVLDVEDASSSRLASVQRGAGDLVAPGEVYAGSNA
ncbi:MAG TPA: hypothetical protein VGD69_10100 [Herpetosiphonaceae bacterium]